MYIVGASDLFPQTPVLVDYTRFEMFPHKATKVGIRTLETMLNQVSIPSSAERPTLDQHRSSGFKDDQLGSAGSLRLN